MTIPRSNASHDQNNVPTLMGVSTADGTTPVPVEVDPLTGALQVAGGTGGGATVVGIGPVGFNSDAYDSVTYTNTSATVDTYQYYAGGTGGVLKATVTITWTDSTKSVLISVVRT